MRQGVDLEDADLVVAAGMGRWPAAEQLRRPARVWVLLRSSGVECMRWGLSACEGVGGGSQAG